MTAITGTALYCTFGGTVLDTDYRSFSHSEETGTVDGSAGSDANRTYLTTLKDGTASVSILIQAGDTSTWDAVAPQSSGTLEWAPEGTASTKPRHYAQAIVTSREMSMEYDDVAVGDVEFQLNGSVTDTTY